MVLIHEPQLLRIKGSLRRRRDALWATSWWAIAPAGIHQLCHRFLPPSFRQSSAAPFGRYRIVSLTTSDVVRRSWSCNFADEAGA